MAPVISTAWPWVTHSPKARDMTALRSMPRVRLSRSSMAAWGYLSLASFKRRAQRRSWRRRHYAGIREDDIAQYRRKGEQEARRTLDAFLGSIEGSAKMLRSVCSGRKRLGVAY